MALTEVRRQKDEWQKSVSEYLSDGKFAQALDLLESNKRIHWNGTREESFSNLVEKWCRDSLEAPEQNRLILALPQQIRYFFINPLRVNMREAGRKLSIQDLSWRY